LWGEYCETWEFVVPRAGVVSGEEAGGTWGGEGEEVWESNWVVEDEEQLEEQRMEREGEEVGDVDRDVSWHCSVNLKYEQRKEEYDEINRKVRVWCGYPVKESGREKINARRREVGLSADIRELMDVEGSEEREELEAYIEVSREAIAERRCIEGEGCEVHVISGEGGRASEILDYLNCGECKEMWDTSLEIAREEMGMRPRERRRVEVEGDSIDEQLTNMMGKLELKWEWLEDSWKNTIQTQAKQLRSCHSHKNKGCKSCDLAKLSAQYMWEQRYVAKRKRCFDSHGGGKRRRVQ
jgi:hypothetical protein